MSVPEPTVRAELVETSSRFHRQLSAYQRGLFVQMMERGDHIPEYGERLLKWLRRGRTLELRELCEPFGSYWRDLGYANSVDSLDAAHCKFSASEKALLS